MSILSKRALNGLGKILSSAGKTQFNKVVLMCNVGRGYLCNPKYIAEALQRLYPNEFDLVLLVNEEDPTAPSYIRQVRRRSFAAQRELATARFWVDNVRSPRYVLKRSDQIYIHTWHCYISPKRVEQDVEDHLEPEYVDYARTDGALTDLMFADNDLYENVYRTAFWYDGPVVRCGVPRNRPLILGDEGARLKVRRALGVDEDASICLYAPTFRADWSVDQYRFDFEAFIRALSKRFGKDYVFAYRLHPNIAKLARPEFLNGYLDATDYLDAQELLAATDVMVSDYSSILEDFALTGRPGFVFAPDFDAYSSDRGFYYSLEDRPFPVARTSDELIANACGFDERGYRKALDRFFSLIGFQDDGHGDEQVAQMIISLSKKGSTVGDILGR